MQTEEMRGAVVDLVLAVRETAELRTWDQVQGRLRVAAQTCCTAEAFATAMQQSMRAVARKSYARAATRLVDISAPDPLAMLRLVDREHGYIIALAQLETDRRHAEREERRQRRAELTTEGEDVDDDE